MYLPFFLVMVFHSSSGAFSAAGDTTTAALGLPALPPFCQAVQCRVRQRARERYRDVNKMDGRKEEAEEQR
jgi:hypothetical protein